jgi:hypothetical protein
MPLTKEALNDVKTVVRRNVADGGLINDAVTLKGVVEETNRLVIVLCRLSLLTHTIHTTWTTRDYVDGVATVWL